MKICPYCAEEIQDEAIKCKHCGEFLDGSGLHTATAKLPPWYFRTSVLIIALLSVGPLALPLIWWHPKLTLLWKVVISVAIVAITWLAIQSTMQALQFMNDTLKDSGMY